MTGRLRHVAGRRSDSCWASMSTHAMATQHHHHWPLASMQESLAHPNQRRTDVEERRQVEVRVVPSVAHHQELGHGLRVEGLVRVQHGLGRACAGLWKGTPFSGRWPRGRGGLPAGHAAQRPDDGPVVPEVKHSSACPPSGLRSCSRQLGACVRRSCWSMTASVDGRPGTLAAWPSWMTGGAGALVPHIAAASCTRLQQCSSARMQAGRTRRRAAHSSAGPQRWLTGAAMKPASQIASSASSMLSVFKEATSTTAASSF